MSSFTSRITYANVVATLALFLALGGVSWAAIKLPKNSVSSSQIKKGGVKNSDLAKNAVTTTKVKNGSLLKSDFKSGQLPAGPQGPQGIQGAKGNPGATNVVVRQSREGSSSTGTVQTEVSCEPGEAMTGGGGGVVLESSTSPASFVTTGGNIVLINGPSSPNGLSEAADGSVPNTWSFAADINSATSSDAVAFAICARP